MSIELLQRPASIPDQVNEPVAPSLGPDHEQRPWAGLQRICGSLVSNALKGADGQSFTTDTYLTGAPGRAIHGNDGVG